MLAFVTGRMGEGRHNPEPPASPRSPLSDAVVVVPVSDAPDLQDCANAAFLL